MTNSRALPRMEQQLRLWETNADRKAVFLGCYTMMTRNMYTGVERGDFADPDWVRMLLENFADYYFKALDEYDRSPEQTMQVWRTAHDAAMVTGITPVQLLFLGVNAHINFDLVLALEDVLSPEWKSLHSSQRASRHADYCHVNDIIAGTIDAVQDTVLTPSMPSMGVVDAMLGRLDEFLISTLLTRWRDEVWDAAVHILEAGNAEDRAAALRNVETQVMERAVVLASPDWSIFRKLL